MNKTFVVSVDGINIFCDKMSNDNGVVYLYLNNNIVSLYYPATRQLKYDFKEGNNIFFNLERR